MKTHPPPANVGYLVVGLVFLGISGAWALHAAGVVDNADTRWLVPAVCSSAGVVGLVAFAAKGVSRRRPARRRRRRRPAYDRTPHVRRGLEPA